MLKIPDHSTLDSSLKVAQFINEQNEWDVARLQQLVDPPRLQLILATPLPTHPIPDSVCWGLTGSGNFSTKSATWAAHNFPSENPVVWEYNWIWRLDIMPKLKTFLWQLCHASLPTKGTLLTRGLTLDPMCSACNTDTEDADHLFLHCPYAQECWHQAIQHQWIPSDFLAGPFTGILQRLSRARSLPSPIRIDRIVALMWSIWKTRNQRVFRHESPSSVFTLLRAKKASAEWRIRHKLTSPFHQSLYPHYPPVTKRVHWVAWRAPPGGSIKINSDGAKSSHGAAGGFIIRNWDGKFLQAASFRIGTASVLVAEATAMRNGIRAAVQAGYTNIHLEGDNQTLIQAVRGLIPPPWEIQVLVHDIQMFMQLCISVHVSHIFREGNRAADWLARLGLSCSSTMMWNEIPHRDLGRILYEDNLGRTLARRAV